jgi:hypothetical protein
MYFTDTANHKEIEMVPIHAIADLYTRTAANDLARSALPNAPVLPDVEPRRRIRRTINMFRRLFRRTIRRPVVQMQPARYSTEC